MIDARLLEWATPRERLYLTTINKPGGSSYKAAAELGVSRSSIQAALRNLRKRATSKGWSPAHDWKHPVPEGFNLDRLSMYVDKDGKRAGRWVIAKADREKQIEVIRETITSWCESVPRAEPTPPPVDVSHQLCNVYVMTDCHVGMLAWGKETGADWDLDIAERTIEGCFRLMVDRAPAAKSCVIAQLGDWLHSDGLQAVTPTSGHLLDQDGRFPKVVAAAVRILRNLVAAALAKHAHVVVLLAEGNHDLASSVWLRVMFRALYENEPRVEVIDSELPYYVHKHGGTMLAFHHGHLKANAQLPLLLASQFPTIWGATTKRYVHTGHRHHVEEKEHPGMTVVQHPTLAARDSYAARGGWVSERQAQAITYHERHGRVGVTVVTPEMLSE